MRSRSAATRSRAGQAICFSALQMTLLASFLLWAAASPTPPSPFAHQAKACWNTAVSDPDAATTLAETVLAEARRARDARSIAEMRLCRGYARERAGKMDEAAQEYEFGVAEGERLGDDGLRADALALRGEYRHTQGRFDAALQDLQQAFRLNAALGRGSKERYALTAIANVYADTNVGDFDRALEYYRRVLASHEQAGDTQEVATTYFNIGATLEKKGDLAAALVELQRALDLERKRGDPEEVAYCERQLAILLTKLDRPAEALPLLESALAAFEAAKDANMVAATRLTRGAARRRLGRSSDALEDLEAARAHFDAEKDDRFLARVHEERALALAATGNWREAYEARGARFEVQQRLSEKTKQEHTARLRVEFDAERKDQDNRALTRENTLQGRVLLLGLVVLGLAGYTLLRKLKDARRLRVLAMTDELTRLPNRRHLFLIAEEELKAARASLKPFTVVAFDIDRFKRINDTLGHAGGDAVLQRVAHACRGALRPADRIGRTGGEEFTVVLPQTPAAAAVEVAERLRAAVESRPCDDLAEGMVVTISGGVAEWTPADRDFASVLNRADAALYRAKEGGRNRMEVAPSTA